MSTSIAFVILRHVNSARTNNYWKHACKSVRLFYPECVLVVIDDNSNYNFVKINDSEKEEIRYSEIEFIQSEYPKRGELLPYLYFIKYKWADSMVFIHDAVFIEKRMEFNKDMMTLWSANERSYIAIRDANGKDIFEASNTGEELWHIFNNNQKENNRLWDVCFGAMCYIKHAVLMHLHNTYDFHKLVDKVNNRGGRQCLERLIPCMYYRLFKSKIPCVIGDIHSTGWGRSWEQYCKMPKEMKEYLGFVKVWTGR